MESIRQLRVICQQTRYDKFFRGDWLHHNIFRRVSIYITRIFLKVGFSANKVTVLKLLPGITAGALLTMPQAKYWLVAWILFLLYKILDCCDGEVSRYRKSASLIGSYNEGLIDIYFLPPFLFACMTFGIYRALGHYLVFISGFTLVISWTIYMLSPKLCEIILSRTGMQKEKLEQIKRVEVPAILSCGIMPYGRMVFNYNGFFLALLILSLLDMFISPFSIGSLDFNIRFIYVTLFALEAVFGSLLRVYDVNKHGVRLHM